MVSRPAGASRKDQHQRRRPHDDARVEHDDGRAPKERGGPPTSKAPGRTTLRMIPAITKGPMNRAVRSPLPTKALTMSLTSSVFLSVERVAGDPTRSSSGRSRASTQSGPGRDSFGRPLREAASEVGSRCPMHLRLATSTVSLSVKVPRAAAQRRLITAADTARMSARFGGGVRSASDGARQARGRNR